MLLLASVILIGCGNSDPGTTAVSSNAKVSTKSGQPTTSTKAEDSTVSWTSLQAQVSKMTELSKSEDQKMEQSKQFISKAVYHLQASQTQSELDDLSQAKSLADAAFKDITEANRVLSEIMKQKLSPIMLKYFQEKQSACTALINGVQIDINAVNALLADPTMSQAETVQIYNTTNSKAQEQLNIVKEAEGQAAKIAADNPDAFQ